MPTTELQKGPLIIKLLRGIFFYSQPVNQKSFHWQNARLQRFNPKHFKVSPRKSAGELVNPVNSGHDWTSACQDNQAIYGFAHEDEGGGDLEGIVIRMSIPHRAKERPRSTRNSRAPMR